MSSLPGSLLITFSPFIVGATVAFGALAYKDATCPQPKHWAQQQRLEKDKAFPTQNKKLDFVIAMAHGT
eukprot:gene6684-6907_t